MSTHPPDNADGRWLDDVSYKVNGPAAVIMIDRPHRYNAFTGKTVEELIKAFRRAWADRAVRAVIFTGAGDKAFCTGGDVKQRAATGDYGPTESGIFEIEHLHRVIREIPKPVIAAVNGLAIGGGHVLHVICDLTIAADHAKFGQAGPKVGSFDAGLGTNFLARAIGEKRAREVWFLCRQYDAATAQSWGLVNKVVPGADLAAEAQRWAEEIAALSPTAIRFLKHSFNADTEHQVGLAHLANAGLDVFLDSDEAKEGAAAFAERRPPTFADFV